MGVAEAAVVSGAAVLAAGWVEGAEQPTRIVAATPRATRCLRIHPMIGVREAGTCAALRWRRHEARIVRRVTGKWKRSETFLNSLAPSESASAGRGASWNSQMPRFVPTSCTNYPYRTTCALSMKTAAASTLGGQIE